MGALCSIIPNENKQYSVKIDGTTVLFHIDKTNLIGTFNAYNESSSDSNIYYTLVIVKYMDTEYLVINRRRSFEKLNSFKVYKFIDGFLSGFVLCFKELTYSDDMIYFYVTKDNKRLYYLDIWIPIEHPYLQKLVLSLNNGVSNY